MSGQLLHPVSGLAKRAGADLALRPARVHEAQGQGAVGFALFQAARHPGPVFWVMLRDAAESLLPLEMPRGVSERLTLVRTAAENDLLWATEEALRASPVALVIAQPAKPLSLTAGRRLQLAAEAGQTTGLLLIRDGQGSNAAETRWQCSARASGGDSTLHRWDLMRNKMGTTGGWTVDWHGQTDSYHLVDEAAERPLAAPSSGCGSLCPDDAGGEQ